MWEVVLESSKNQNGVDTLDKYEKVLRAGMVENCSIENYLFDENRPVSNGIVPLVLNDNTRSESMIGFIFVSASLWSDCCSYIRESNRCVRFERVSLFELKLFFEKEPREAYLKYISQHSRVLSGFCLLDLGDFEHKEA